MKNVDFKIHGDLKNTDFSNGKYFLDRLASRIIRKNIWNIQFLR
jgi:hypothetical protein